MFKTPKLPVFSLRRSEYRDYSTDSNSDMAPWFFCGESIQEVFHTPKDAEFIQLVAHREPGPDRWEVYFRNGYAFVEVHDSNEPTYEEVYWMDQDTLVSINKMLDGRRKKWYVECYYWE